MRIYKIGVTSRREQFLEKAFQMYEALQKLEVLYQDLSKQQEGLEGDVKARADVLIENVTTVTRAAFADFDEIFSTLAGSCMVKPRPSARSMPLKQQVRYGKRRVESCGVEKLPRSVFLLPEI